MSFTRTVPSVVPSDFQSSLPELASYAAKYKIEPTAVGSEKLEPSGPGLISLTKAGAAESSRRDSSGSWPPGAR
jgi:hypothetical protein